MPMLAHPSEKYLPYEAVPFPQGYNRIWPTRRVTRAPAWLNTDLRDGNQALANPMTNEHKLALFKALLKCGFKEIEVAYPTASDAEFEFCRTLIDDGHIPDGVAVQVISPMIPALLKRSILALAGAKHAIIHLYAATSPLFRQVVFRATKEETIKRAVSSVKLMRELADEVEREYGTVYQLNYCPETFSQTEIDFAVEICEAVKAAWGIAGTGDKQKVIFNMPATVEVGPPNHYADQVEYFATHITNRECCILSAHPHNDRGCGVAAAELALCAGADRVEGCLLGNGERTGNVDIITLALNLYSQGISPALDFSDLPGLTALVEKCTGMKCPDRYPYAGKLVFAAFAGTHQDAIKKGFEMREKKLQKGEKAIWSIPYIPVDPADLGCSYEAVIRVNSQSGRAGSAYLIKQSLGLDLPRAFQAHFGKLVQQESDRTGKELTSSFITNCFKRTYHLGTHPDVHGRLFLRSFTISPVSPSSSDSDSDVTDIPHDYETLDNTVIGAVSDGIEVVRVQGEISVDGVTRNVSGMGSSPMTALLQALRAALAVDLNVNTLDAHPLPPDNSMVAAYVEVSPSAERFTKFFGVGVSSSIVAAHLRAIISATNASLPTGHIFPPPRHHRPVVQSRSSSITSIRVEDIKLRTGKPPRIFDANEWRQEVEA
ncbi:2-isopropylmalate synthase [Ramaria rubella]|nr:2-isopropylmalate synthase [Ramaria rubella]